MAAASTFIEEGRHRISLATKVAPPPPQPRGLINDTEANFRARLQNASSETSCELSQISACQSARGARCSCRILLISDLGGGSTRSLSCQRPVAFVQSLSGNPVAKKTNAQAAVLLRSRPFVSSVFLSPPPSSRRFFICLWQPADGLLYYS